MIALLLMLHSVLEWTDRAPMPEPRAGLIAGVIDGRMLVAGGSYWQADQKHVSARADWFDPKTNRWSAAPALPASRSDAASASVAGGVYAFGGVVDGAMSATVLRFDGHAWTAQAELPHPTMYAVAATAGDDVFLFGGLMQQGELASASRELLRFRPGKGWTPLAAFPGRSRVTAAFASHDGKLYVFGGVHKDPAKDIENLDDAWSYDIATDRWSQLPRLPIARRAWSAISDGKRILLLGGYTDGFSTEVYAFQPKDGLTTAAGVLPHPLADARYVRIGDRLLTAGGETAMKVRGAWTIEGMLR